MQKKNLLMRIDGLIKDVNNEVGWGPEVQGWRTPSFFLFKPFHALWFLPKRFFLPNVFFIRIQVSGGSSAQVGRIVAN